MVFGLCLRSRLTYALCSHIKVRVYDCVLHDAISFTLSLSIASRNEDWYYFAMLIDGDISQADNSYQ